MEERSSIPRRPLPRRRRSAPIFAGALGLTLKQERFAQLVANGHKLSAAYRQAYDTDGMRSPTVWREAHRLSRNGKVLDRIQQLQQEMVGAVEPVQGWIEICVIRALEEMMAKGKSERSRLRAAELLGKSLGLFSIRKRAPNVGAGPSLSELESRLEALLSRLA